MLGWIRNLDDAASEVGSGPVGGGGGYYARMLVGIGRVVVVGLGLAALARLLSLRG